MLFQRELLTLIIAAFATSNASAATAPERNLRGSSDIAEVVEAEESPASLADEHVEDRQLQSDTGLANGNGHYKVKGQPITTTTVAPITVAPVTPDSGGAVEDPGDGTPTSDPVAAVCEPACSSDQICAQSSPDATAQCYDKCVAFPSLDSCSGTDICVYSTFTCGGSTSVFNDFCECTSGSYQDGCRPSECGLFVRD